MEGVATPSKPRNAAGFAHDAEGGYVVMKGK
jgi:hypothetical protein